MKVVLRLCSPALLAAAVIACTPAVAGASEVLVFDHGRATPVEDRFLPPAEQMTPPGRGTPVVRPVASAAGYLANVKAVQDALRRAHDAKLISDKRYESYLGTYDVARQTRDKLRGRCRSQLDYVVYTVERLAKAGRLYASRMTAIFEQLHRNTEFWSAKPSPAIGDRERVRFRYGIIYQHYRGQGLQIQPLGTFGKAGAIAQACLEQGLTSRDCATTSLRRLLDGMKAIVSERGGTATKKPFKTWEYWFDWEGGFPGWTSGMADATGIQAYARASKIFKRPEYLTLASSALGVFEQAPPAGVRVRGIGGAHYLLYSFAPKMRVANAFAQTVLGLFDYTQITGDPRGRRLYEAGDRALRREIPYADSGKWSRYNYPRGPESNYSYHVLLRDFLRELCQKTHQSVFCRYAAKFTAYTHRRGAPQPPREGGQPNRRTCGFT